MVGEEKVDKVPNTTSEVADGVPANNTPKIPTNAPANPPAEEVPEAPAEEGVPSKPFVCEVCGKLFDTKRTLTAPFPVLRCTI